MSARKVDNEISDFLQFHRLGKKPHIILNIENEQGLLTAKIDISKIPPMLIDKDLAELKSQIEEEQSKRKGANVTAS